MNKELEWVRFWDKVAIRAPTECWEWQGAVSKNGYGSFKLNGRAVTASRFAFKLSSGADAGNKMVLHTCDNRKCCNPNHLYKGTVKENTRDMMERGRHRPGSIYGSANHKAKLTEEQVAGVKTLIIRGMTNTAIAARYGVTHQMISKIRRGHFWKAVGAA